MQAQAQRMRRLIEGLLAYACVKTRGQPFAAVDLSCPVRQALDDLALRLQEAGATAEVDKLPTVLGDELQLYQLCQNLIGNALKYVAKGTIPRVRISARPMNAGMVEILIQDNGIGFEEKDRERIFQPFQRLHTEKEYPGSGIGLAVCQKIVERHGGRIWAESVPGEGTTFHFTLTT
jgi:light-regulated signal transduction histidine kinase (bacteriophytochrome)